MLSEKSHKYFSAAILVSGSVYNHWALMNKGKIEKTKTDLARFVNCPTSNNYKLVACLRQINPNTLTVAQVFMLVCLESIYSNKTSILHWEYYDDLIVSYRVGFPFLPYYFPQW